MYIIAVVIPIGVTDLWPGPLGVEDSADFEQEICSQNWPGEKLQAIVGGVAKVNDNGRWSEKLSTFSEQDISMIK